MAALPCTQIFTNEQDTATIKASLWLLHPSSLSFKSNQDRAANILLLPPPSNHDVKSDQDRAATGFAMATTP